MEQGNYPELIQSFLTMLACHQHYLHLLLPMGLQWMDVGKD